MTIGGVWSRVLQANFVLLGGRIINNITVVTDDTDGSATDSTTCRTGRCMSIGMSVNMMGRSMTTVPITALTFITTITIALIIITMITVMVIIINAANVTTGTQHNTLTNALISLVSCSNSIAVHDAVTS